MTVSNNIAIRMATKADLEVLVRFQIAMASESEDKGLDENTLRHGIATTLSSEDLALYIVAEIAGKPVGTLMVDFGGSRAFTLLLQTVDLACTRQCIITFFPSHQKIQRRRGSGCMSKRIMTARKRPTVSSAWLKPITDYSKRNSSGINTLIRMERPLGSPVLINFSGGLESPIRAI